MDIPSYLYNYQRCLTEIIRMEVLPLEVQDGSFHDVLNSFAWMNM